MDKTKHDLGWNWHNVKNEIWDSVDPHVTEFLNTCIEKKCKSLLDIGAGNGRHAILFSMHGIQVLALDNSESAISIINQKIQLLNAQCSTMLWDMHRICQLGQKFDAVLANNSIYHTNEMGLLSIISSIKELMNPNGIGYATFLSTKDYSYNGCKVRNKLEEDGSILEHIYLTLDEVRYLFRDYSSYTIDTICYDVNGKNSVHYAVTFRN